MALLFAFRWAAKYYQSVNALLLAVNIFGLNFKFSYICNN